MWNEHKKPFSKTQKCETSYRARQRCLGSILYHFGDWFITTKDTKIYRANVLYVGENILYYTTMLYYGGH